MKIILQVWRQENSKTQGRFVKYEMSDVSPDMSFLEMLDMLNEKLESQSDAPVVFDHDCREGICGACSMMINGKAHGPEKLTTTCQLHMRSFKDGDTIFVEPWRSSAFPVVRDLMVDRGSFERIIQAGGFVSVKSGSAPEANSIVVPRHKAELAMDAAACIGCGACVAACPNGSAMLFTAAKVSHLALLPQGQPERMQRVKNMVKAMDQEFFGPCTNYGECQEACPKGISISFISKMNREFLMSSISGQDTEAKGVKAQ